MLDEEEEETQTSVASTPLDDLFAVFSPMPDGKDSDFDATSDGDTFGNRKADFDPSEADFWDIPLDSKRSPGRRFELAAGHEGDILEDDDAEYEADVSSPPFDNFFEGYDERQTSDSDLDNGSCSEGYRAPAFIDGDCDVEAAPAFTIGPHDQGEPIRGLVESHDLARNIDRSYWNATFASSSDRPSEFKPALCSAFLEDIFAETGQGAAFVPLSSSGQEVDDSHFLSSLPRNLKSHDLGAPLLDFDNPLNAHSNQNSIPKIQSMLIEDDIIGL